MKKYTTEQQQRDIELRINTLLVEKFETGFELEGAYDYMSSQHGFYPSYDTKLKYNWDNNSIDIEVCYIRDRGERKAYYSIDIDELIEKLENIEETSDEEEMLDFLETEIKDTKFELTIFNEEESEVNTDTTEYKVEGIEEVYEKEDDDNSTLSFYKEWAESANRLLHKYKDCEDSFEITMEDITTIDEIQIEFYGSEKYEWLAETQGVNSNIIDMDKFRKLLEDIRDNLSMEYYLYKVNNK